MPHATVNILSTRRLWLASALGLGLVFTSVQTLRAEDPKEKAVEVKGDLKTLQGDWVSKDDSGETTWSFKGDRLSLKTPTRSYEMTVKLDADAKPEKAIDFRVLDTSPEAKNTKADGIYKIDGEKVQICFAMQETGRPKEFKMDFPNSFLFELKKK